MFVSKGDNAEKNSEVDNFRRAKAENLYSKIMDLPCLCVTAANSQFSAHLKPLAPKIAGSCLEDLFGLHVLLSQFGARASVLLGICILSF